MSTLIVNTINSATSGQAVAVDVQNPKSFRNKIINGAQVVDQRGLSTEATPAHDDYLTDRWNAHLSQGSKYKVQQVTESPAGFTNSLKVTSLSAYTPVAADYFLINQYIEGYNMSDLGWGAVGAKTVTISFWVRSSVTGNYALALRQPWNRAQNQSYTISSADTWEKKSLTFTGDTSGTWNTTNGQGMSVGFILGGGSNYEATSGSWGAGSHFRFNGATNLVSTNAATFYVTGVQLEVGSVATDFEHRSYAQELALCQRYFYPFLRGTYSYENITLGHNYNSTTGIVLLEPPVEMRDTPSLTTSGTIGADDDTSIGFTFEGQGSVRCFRCNITSHSKTSGQGFQLRSHNSTTAKFELSAEL